MFNVEMQTSVPSELPSRLAYYVASLYVGQLREGDHYVDLRPAIGICVLDGVLFRSNPSIHLDFRLRSEAAEELLTDALQVHLLELPKYRPPSDNRNITDPIEAWAYFFREAENLTAEELAGRLGDNAFTEAAGVLEMIARNPEERSQYEARLKLQRDERARLQAAEERGRAKGVAEGRAEGALLGRIHLLRQLLNQTASDDLSQLSFDDLARLEADLQRQLRERS